MLLEQALVPLFTNEPTNKLPCFSLFFVSTRCFEFLIPSLLKNHLHNGLMQLNGGCLSNPYLGFLAKCNGEVPPNGNVKVYHFIHQFSSESSNTQPILDFWECGTVIGVQNSVYVPVCGEMCTNNIK